jgi:hypothetical protein
LIGLGQLERAEGYLRESTDKAKYAKAAAKDGEHPDRILHVWHLVDCLERQQRNQEALELCRELQGNISNIGGHDLGRKHKFYVTLTKRIESLEGKVKMAELVAV